jgi:hypothetical protein
MTELRLATGPGLHLADGDAAGVEPRGHRGFREELAERQKNGRIRSAIDAVAMSVPTGRAAPESPARAA